MTYCFYNLLVAVWRWHLAKDPVKFKLIVFPISIHEAYTYRLLLLLFVFLALQPNVVVFSQPSSGL